jgi:Tol biopolymer transport system component
LEIGNLVVVDVTSGTTTQITDLDPRSHAWWFMSPSFSPDGQTIIFHLPRGRQGADTRWDVWSVPVAGGDPSVLVADASMGVYSPDGAHLVYVDSPRGIWTSPRLMIADADGSDPSLLVEGAAIDFSRWSPDGTRLSYRDAGRTYVVDVATGETSLVANGEAADWVGNDALVVVPA